MMYASQNLGRKDGLAKDIWTDGAMCFRKGDGEEGDGKMTLFSQLFSFYSFNGLLSLVATWLGPGNLIILASGLLATAAAFASLPMRGALIVHDTLVAGASYVQQFFYITSLLLFAMVLFTGWGPFLTFIVYYLPIIISMLCCSERMPQILDFDLLTERQRSKNGLSLRFVRKLWPLALLWLVLLGEILAFSCFDPVMPLLSWIFMIYSLVYGFLMAAFWQGIILQYQSSKWVRVALVDGTEERGFLVGKGGDHYLILKKDGEDLVQASAVRKITPEPVPDDKAL